MNTSLFNFLTFHFRLKNLFQFTGIVLLALILYRINLAETKSVLLSVSQFHFFTALILTIPIIAFRSLRWTLILRYFSIVISFAKSFFYYSAGLIGLISPGKIGEFVKVFYLLENNGQSIESILSIIIDRSFDLIIILGVATFTLVHFFPGDVHKNYIIISVLTVLVIASLVVLLLNRNWGRSFLNIVVTPLVPEHLKNQINDRDQQVIKYSSNGIYLIFVLGIPLSIAVFGLQVLRLKYMARALSLEPGFFWLAGVISITSLVNLLPITISGIGTRDSVFLFFFTGMGIPEPTVMALSFLVLLTNFFYGIVGTFCLIALPPKVNLKLSNITNNE